MSGFGKKVKLQQIPLREYSVEYKYRPPEDETGELEEERDRRILHIPVLRDASLEKQWVRVAVWNALNSEEIKQRGINQAFVYQAGFENLFLRLETQPFVDEPSEVLNPPSNEDYRAWINSLDKRLKVLYGITLREWQDFNAGNTGKGSNTKQSADSPCSEGATEAIAT